MSTEKTETISKEEYDERCKKAGRAIPVVKAEATVKIISKDGSERTLQFSSEEMNDAD